MDEENRDTTAGEEKIRDGVESATRVYPREFEPFLGFTSIKAVQDKLEKLKNAAVGDISKFYEQEFLDAAAALAEKDPGAFIRLRNNVLKPKGIAITGWQRTVHEIQYKERERIAQAAKDAKQATAAQPRPGSGQKLNLADPVPCDVPVDGAELANEVAQIIRRFVVVGEPLVDTIVLWVFFTYLIEVFEIAPRLAITSPVKRCGKTTLIKLLRQLVARALACSNISSAAIYRTIERALPTLLMDEMDTYVQGRGATNNSAAEELRGILNSGHDRATAFVIRLVLVGDDYEPRQFSTFTPIVHALIGALPDTLRDRSIPIDMKRKRPAEKVERFDRGQKKRITALFESFRSRIARWCRDHRDIVSTAEPSLPKELLEDGADERAGDNWVMLLAIADALGGHWPERARMAAVTLSGKSADDGVAVILLRDLRDIFNKDTSDQIASRAICDKLVDIEGGPWATYGKSRKPISQNQLARLLRPFQIEPKTIRIGPEPSDTARGYERKDLEDTWARYLPPPQPRSADSGDGDIKVVDPCFSPKSPSSADPDQHGDTTTGAVGRNGDFATDTNSLCVGSKNGVSPYAERGCVGCVSSKTGNEGKEEKQPHSPPPGEAADDPSPNGIPFVMAGWMKACLRHLGHGDEEIARMKPAEGHAVINARLRELGLNERSMTPEQKLAAIHNHDSADNDEWEF